MSTITECTGQCCEDITLRSQGGHGDPLTWGQIKVRKAHHLAQMLEENHLERLLIPQSPVSDSTGLFTCALFDPDSRRCLDYDRRPATCRSYPHNTIQNGQRSNTCRFCGATAEAA